MSEEAKAIETVQDQDEPLKTEKQISLYYGERSEIRELVDRMRAGLPNALAVPDSGIRALATAAYAHDLDPWNGEIWVIYNENKGETSLMAGVKGLRKAAKRQLADGHHYYLDFTPIMPEEYPQYGLDTPDAKGRPVELAEICHLRRGDACEQYSKTLRQVFDMCGSFEIAREMLGPMPVYVGIGVVRKGEKSKMERCQLVKKRAESDALKRAFDLPFSDRVNGNGGSVTVGNADDDSIEGEFQVMDGGDGSGEHRPALAAAPEQLNLKDLDRPLDPELLQEYVRSNGYPLFPGDGATDKQRKVLTGLLKGLYKGSATQEKDAKAYLEFVAGTDTTEKLSKKTASVLIDLVKADGDDEWGPSDEAKEEAQRVLREVYKDQGQMDMFEDGDNDEEPPADEPKSELDQAFPRDKDGNLVEDNADDKPKPEDKPKKKKAKAAVKAQSVKAEKKVAVKPETNKTEDKPAEPAKDNGEDPTILALKRSKPSSWLVASEWLRKHFKGFSMTPGQLREAVLEKKGMKFEDKLDVLDGWTVAIELGQAATK